MALFTSDDEDKEVKSAEGETVGYVTRVEDGTAYVSPDADLSTETRTEIGWPAPTEGEEAYPLESDDVDSKSDDSVNLLPVR